MRRQRVSALVYGACAVFSAGLGIRWWALDGDAVLGGLFLVLAGLSVLAYRLLTQPLRRRARRDAERTAIASTTVPPGPDLPPGAGEIVVVRPAGYYVAVFRRYRVLVDGRPAGVVGRGETLRCPVSPGQHTVAARIDWSGSPEVSVDVPAGGRVTVEVEPAGDAFAGTFSPDRMLTLTVSP